MKVRVNPNNFELIDFHCEKNGQPFIITLREKPDWPMVLDMPLILVESWFIDQFSLLLGLL